MTTPLIHVTENALQGIVDSTFAAVPNETGGALIGWREGDLVSIRTFIEIPTKRPERSRFELDLDDLNAALANYLSTAGDARLGYVGSWHSHPAPAGPSFTDKHTFRKTARAHRFPLAFLVTAARERSIEIHPTWVGKRFGRCRLIDQPTISRTG